VLRCGPHGRLLPGHRAHPPGALYRRYTASPIGYAKPIFASLEEGPAIPAIQRREGLQGRQRRRLNTGVLIGRGFAPGRLISHSPDGSPTLYEWACRGGILQHLLIVRDALTGCSVDDESISLHLEVVGDGGGGGGGSTSLSRPPPPNRAVAQVVLWVPQRLWQRGRIEAKDARARAAFVAVFSHARCNWANEGILRLPHLERGEASGGGGGGGGRGEGGGGGGGG
jgi:hypothetical protein